MQFKTSLLILGITMLTFFLMPQIANAQELTEFFSLTYSKASASDFTNANKNVAIENIEANLITPTIDLGKKTKLNNLLSYKVASYDFNQDDHNANDYPNKLTDIQYSLLIRQQINNQWSIFALPQLSVRSDFQHNFTGNDLFPALAVIAFQKPKKFKKLEIGYGISYSRDYTKNTLSPILSILYINPKFRIDALLPAKAQFIMTPGRSWEYGLEMTLNTAIYRVNISDPKIKYVRSTNIPVNLSLARKISGMLWAKAEAGFILSRQYDMLDGDYRVYQDQKNVIKPAGYIALGISLRSSN